MEMLIFIHMNSRALAKTTTQPTSTEDIETHTMQAEDNLMSTWEYRGNILGKHARDEDV
jgi:hypothetical protein